jgi:hypothetical protein
MTIYRSILLMPGFRRGCNVTYLTMQSERNNKM